MENKKCYKTDKYFHNRLIPHMPISANGAVHTHSKGALELAINYNL